MTINLSDRDVVTPLRQQRATRMIFFVAGLGMASWAPLIPFVKNRVNADDATLGLLLFCIAAGAMLMMPFTSRLIARFSYRLIILCCCIALALILPLLLIGTSLGALAVLLLCFGAANGILDVTMNAQAIVVEQASGQANMSGFHGFYSLGSIAGAGGVSMLLGASLPPIMAAALVAAGVLLLALMAFPQLLRRRHAHRAQQQGVLQALCQRVVLIVAVLCFFIFLIEGAMLDWSAIFMATERGMALHHAGFGFAIYSIAVAIGRLYGDRIINRIGGTKVLTGGGLLAAGALSVLLVSTSVPLALGAIFFIGLGLANIIPLLFTTAGNQPELSADVAIPAVTLVGYSGLLAGPALIGFSAHWVGLSATFVAGVFILLAVALSARQVMARQ
ncbi:putative MFS-type transporter (plasmid) [Duffyella gerundensis]|uniref:Putative MFS-type transporter n=1 Tax=Duffyella gerundensis TaxID=1619313 RepID=A0A0U5LBA5_9GAMM|nr:MFS transporter [Duffyella gerundensis]CUU25751.1 putative MFS-type transporter [Duffyella gerundensis]